MWLLPDSDLHFRKAHKKGGYQNGLIDEAMKYSRKRGLAIDIGAHVGFLSDKMAKHYKRVIAFEPNPENVLCFRENCPGIPIIPVALGNRVGLAGMFNPKLINSGAWELSDGNDATVLPLDMFNLQPDLIKIDTQGSEAEILRGEKNTI